MCCRGRAGRRGGPRAGGAAVEARLWRPAVPVSRGAGIGLASGRQLLRRGTITL